MIGRTSAENRPSVSVQALPFVPKNNHQFKRGPTQGAIGAHLAASFGRIDSQEFHTSHDDRSQEPRTPKLYEMLLNTEKAMNFTIMESHLTELEDIGERSQMRSHKMGLGVVEKAKSQDQIRRVVFLKDSLHFHYLPYICFQSKSNCEYGRRCALSHNQSEVLFHPLKYKTSLCSTHNSKEEIATCPFAHSQEGLREVRELVQFGVSPPLPQSLSSSSNLSELNDKRAQSQNEEKVVHTSNLMHHSPNGINNPGILNPSYDENLITHLDLRSFKVRPCPSPDTHNPKRCVYYHDSNKDRRRLPHLYTAELCQIIGAGQECPDGDHCSYAHNRVEQFYHPDKYKTKFCTTYPTGYPVNPMVSCEYGNFCAFAHNILDIRIDLLHHYRKDMDFYLFHYKTVWCPFNESEHDRSSCVYAHNWQDFRRKWHFYFYEAEQCTHWNSKNYITNYNQGCPDGRQCKRSHGWKELEFHPYYYKTTICKYGQGCTKAHCPFFHKREEKRDVNFDGFQIVPKTRSTCFQTAAYVGDLFQGMEQRNLESDHNRFLVNTSSLGVIQDLRNSRDQIAGSVVRSGSGLGWQLYGQPPRYQRQHNHPPRPPPYNPQRAPQNNMYYNGGNPYLDQRHGNQYMSNSQPMMPPPQPMGYSPMYQPRPMQMPQQYYPNYQPQQQTMHMYGPQMGGSEWGQGYMNGDQPQLSASNSYHSQISANKGGNGAASGQSPTFTSMKGLQNKHSASLNQISLMRGADSPLHLDSRQRSMKLQPPPGFNESVRGIVQSRSNHEIFGQRSEMKEEVPSIEGGKKQNMAVITEMPSGPMFGKIRVQSATKIGDAKASPGATEEQESYEYENSSGSDSENGKQYKTLAEFLSKHKFRGSLRNSFEMQDITLDKLMSLSEAKINSFSFFESESERHRLKQCVAALREECS